MAYSMAGLACLSWDCFILFAACSNAAFASSLVFFICSANNRCRFISNFSSRIFSSPGVLAVVEEEWCLLCGGMYGIVISEFCCGQPFFPIILSIADECAKVLFDVLIHAFCLSICLRMIGCGWVLFGAENREKLFDVFGHESGVSVMDDAAGESMIAYDSISYNLCESF
jgi:hypothetical protein